MLRMLSHVTVFLALLAVFADADTSVKHTHVYPTDQQGVFAIGWATKDPAGSVCVVDSVGKFTGASEAWSEGPYSAVTHWVVVDGLKDGQSYVYSCGDGSVMSSNFTLKVPASVGTKYAVYGDFGLVNDRSLDDLKASASAGLFDAILHVGDAAYDLHDDNGNRGDLWEASMESLTSSMPYSMLPGNHEAEANFSHYRHRFAAGNMISRKTGTNLYWSYDHGLIHFIGFSSEMFYYSPDKGEQQRLYNFLKADLAAANANRMNVPWVIAMAHKGSWMDKTDYSVLAGILEEQGVDLLLVGHVHNYERMFPFDPTNPTSTVQRYSNPGVYDSPKHLTTIVVGSPGCQEDINSDKPYGPPGANADAVVHNSYGYGIFHVNTTALSWQWAQTSTSDEHLETIRRSRSKDHLILDSFVLTNPRRGRHSEL